MKTTSLREFGGMAYGLPAIDCDKDQDAGW